MKALTLWQPWASLIGAPPLKDVENRGWSPPKYIIGERIAIHAGKKYDEDAAEDIRDMFVTDPALYKRIDGILCDAIDVSGAIVATAIVDGGRSGQDAPRDNRWFGGPIGWRLRDIHRLIVPVECRGAQGLWNVPNELLKTISRRMRLQ